MPARMSFVISTYKPRSSTPGLVDRIFGQMFVDYAGLPFVSAKRDTDFCLEVKLLISVSIIGFRLVLLVPRPCVSN